MGSFLVSVSAGDAFRASPTLFHDFPFNAEAGANPSD